MNLIPIPDCANIRVANHFLEEVPLRMRQQNSASSEHFVDRGDACSLAEPRRTAPAAGNGLPCAGSATSVQLAARKTSAQREIDLLVPLDYVYLKLRGIAEQEDVCAGGAPTHLSRSGYHFLH